MFENRKARRENKKQSKEALRELAPSRRELRQEKKEKKHLEEQEKEAEKLEQKHQKELRKQERQEKAAEKRQELKQQKEERRQEKEEQQRLKSIVVFDTETTGFQPDNDELLQFSAIDGSGTVLFETYIKPENKRRWPYAQKVNGISPSMVANAPSINEVKSKILRILNSAKILVGYNINFDLSFLQSEIAFKPSNKQEIFDVMEEFATTYGDLYGNRKRKKLVDAAGSYGYEYNAHDSLEDARATLFVYNKLNNHEQPAKIPDKIPADNKKSITIDDDQTNDELFDSLSNENIPKEILQRVKSEYTAEKLERFISDTIIRSMDDNGIEKDELASLTSVSTSMVTKWMKPGYNYTIKQLVQIADALNLDIEINLKQK